MQSVDAIVLSAGRASRFGVPKFLLPAGQGHIVLTRVVEQALQVVDGRVAVVLGWEARVARYALERWLEAQPGNPGSRVHVVLNRHYPHGQSTSLKAGLRAFGNSLGVWVFLADMPALEPHRLKQLWQAIQQRSTQTVAVAAAEQGRLRPPVFLSRQLFAEALKLTGDQGARAILKAYPKQIERVEWGSGPWFHDVDDWKTYQELAQKLGWADERFDPIPPEKTSIPPIKELLDTALAKDPVPWLSPGLLLLASKSETRWLLLPQSYRGVQGVIWGPAQTPAAYLQLLRRACLAVLAANRPIGFSQIP